MTLDEVYEYFGSLNKACEALGIVRQSATLWRKRGYIPITQQLRLEKITKGDLIANENQAFAREEPIKEFWPNYRYFDKVHGMCEVDSIYFGEGLRAKITYRVNGTRQKKISTFKTDNLMQMVNVKDKTGKHVYERDVVIRENNTVFVFSDITLLGQLLKISKFKIIGNTHDGKDYGIDPGKIAGRNQED